MTYPEYLKSSQWRKLKLQALRYAGYRCQVCNFNGDLNVHHRAYPECFGYEPVNDLVVLCRNCHNLFHQSTHFKIPPQMRPTNFTPVKSTVVYVTKKKREWSR